MPKLKTKSAFKKRCKIKKGKVIIMTQSNKRHGMRKLSSRAKRSQRGTTVANKAATKILMKSAFV